MPFIMYIPSKSYNYNSHKEIYVHMLIYSSNDIYVYIYMYIIDISKIYILELFFPEHKHFPL